MADVIMTVNSDKTASLDRSYLAVQGEQITLTVNIATVLQTLVTNNSYSAFIDFLQPDGLSYFKGPFTPASETFDFTLGATDSILDKDGFVYWQFLLCEYDTEEETRTVKWASKKYRTEVLPSVGATSSAVLPYIPQMVFPTSYPAANIELADVGGYFTEDTAEAALQQIKSENATHLADESAHDIGNKTYTEQNYITDDESITNSLNALDMEVKDIIDGGSSTPFGEMPYVGTAPIVESGSNASGSYVKFADGTMIVICEYTASVTTSKGGDDSFYNVAIPSSEPFPIAFIAEPFFLGASTDDAQVISVSVDHTSITTTTHRVTLHTRVSRSAASVDIKATFLGKWK